MQTKTISILGCGYLGLPVARELIAKGWRVRGSTTRKRKLVTLVEAGIEPYLLHLDPTVQGPALDDFFRSEHMLINFPPGRRRPDVESFLPEAIQALIARMHHVRHVVFASSTSVYASGNVDETDDALPSGPSGRALRQAETLLMASGKFTTTTLRLGGLYGYTRPPGRFLRTVRNGAAPVNLVHRDDAVAVMLRVIEQPGAGRVFNVVADHHPRKEDFYRQAAQWLDRPPPEVRYEKTVPGKCVSNHRLKQELGYRFLHPDPMKPAP